MMVFLLMVLGAVRAQAQAPYPTIQILGLTGYCTGAGCGVAQVPNTTALRAACTASSGCPSGHQVFTAGVTRLTDGAAGATPLFFAVGTSACSTDDGASCVDSADGKSWLGQFPASGADVREWGAVDNDTDVSASVQKAATALCAAGGGTLLIPAQGAMYKFHDISVPCGGVHVRGTGNVAGVFTTRTSTSSLVDCSAMTSYCLRFAPAGYPANTRLVDDSVEDVQFWNNGSGTGFVLQCFQCQGGRFAHIQMWKPPNGVQLIGVWSFALDDIDENNLLGTHTDISGNLTGYDSNGISPCVGSDWPTCSTRTDFVTLTKLYGWANNNTNPKFVYIHDQAFTINGSHDAFENGAYGLEVTCAAGQPDITYCPQEIDLDNFQTEGATVPVSLLDASTFRCTKCYFLGYYASGGGSLNTSNDVYAGFQNYSQAGGAGAGMQISDAEIATATNSCVYTNINDIQISGSKIWNCNKVSSGGEGINIQTGQQVQLNSDIFCTVSGTTPSTMAGIGVQSAASYVSIVNPMYYGCSGGLADNSSSPYTVTQRGSQGPGGAPVIASCGGGTPGVSGTDAAMSITPGSGNPTTCTVDFGSAQPIAPQCVVSETPGSSGTALGVIATTTQVEVSAATGSSSSTFNVTCLPY